MRYAANRSAVAARERFPGRAITEADGDLWLVKLALGSRVLALTHQANLDALSLDDRVSTGRIDPAARSDPDPLLDLSGGLADSVYDWWGANPPPLLYRSRTMPGPGRNIAFTRTAGISVVDAGPLRRATSLHVNLVLRSGFTVPSIWLSGR